MRNAQTDAVWAGLTLTRGVYENWCESARNCWEMLPVDRVRERREIMADRLRTAHKGYEGTLLVDWLGIADQLLADTRP
jgi:hypothetical protein